MKKNCNNWETMLFLVLPETGVAVFAVMLHQSTAVRNERYRLPNIFSHRYRLSCGNVGKNIRLYFLHDKW